MGCVEYNSRIMTLCEEKTDVKTVLFVDYENIQKIDVDLIDKKTTEIVLFVGADQNRIPFNLVERAQSFGPNLRWQKIAGKGKNNLDFHIAYKLGELNQTSESDVDFIVLSKDTGYDPLIRFISQTGRRCTRIKNVAELHQKGASLPESQLTATVLENLRKIEAKKRPRSRKTLRSHIVALLKEKAKPNEIDEIMEELFVKETLSEMNGRLKYYLD